MSKQDNAVKIKILDKEYLVSCPDDEKEALDASARKCRKFAVAEKLLALTVSP